MEISFPLYTKWSVKNANHTELRLVVILPHDGVLCNTVVHLVCNLTIAASDLLNGLRVKL